MKHIDPTLVLKGDEEDATSIVTKALEALQQSVDDRLKAVETKSADTAKIVTRLDTLETKLNRPTGALETKEAGEAERKALALYARQDDDTELKSLSVGSDPDGGYLVLPTLESGIRTIAKDTSPIRSLASSVTIGTDSYDVILDISDVESAWVGEKTDRPETDGPGLIKKSIVVHEMYAAPRATQKILDDASMDLGGWLEGKIGARFGEVETNAYAVGDGVNKPRGFLTYETDVAADFTRTWGKFQHVISGGATTITADALVRLSLTLRSPYRPNATWLMARETAIQVRQLKDAQGAYLWQAGILEGQPDRLLGIPVAYDDNMPAVAAGTLPIALADFKQTYQIVDRHGIRVIRDNLTAKPYTIFYAYKRTGGDVVDFNALKFLKVAAS
jgi:HK97 family phage major capsid protein